MPKDLFTWDGDDLQMQGDGTGVAFSVGDIGGNDTFNIRVPEEGFSVADLRTGTQVGLLATLATLDTTNLTGRIVHVAGQTALGDTGAGDYLYFATGRTGVTIDGYNFVSAVGADDYFKRLEPVSIGLVADLTAMFGLTDAADQDLTFVKSPAGAFYYDIDATDTIDGVGVYPGVGGTLEFTGGVFSGTAGTGRWFSLNPITGDKVLANSLAITTGVDGEAMDVVGYSAVGDAGPAWEMIYRATGRTGITADGGHYINGPGADDYWEAADKSVAIPGRFGSAGDGVTDDLTEIQAAVTAAGIGGKIIISKDHVISDEIVLLEGQTVEWISDGKLTLDDGGSSITRMISASKPNIKLVNPRLDMDRANNTHDGSAGTQSAISSYGTGENLRIIGGVIENALDNGFQGGRDGLLIDGTIITGSGEHAIYINGLDANGAGLHADGITLRNLRVDDVGQLSTPPFSEAHGIQIRNANSVVIENPVLHLGDPGVDSFYFLLDGVQGVQITGGIGTGCNHTAMFCNTDVFDVVLRGFKGSHTTGSSKSYIRCTTANNITVSDCVFDGFFGTNNTQSPTLVERTDFINTPSTFYSTTGGVFRNCSWTPAAGYSDSSILRLERSGGKFYDCTINGDVAIGVWCRNLPTSYSGTHTGANDQATVLTDAGASWTSDLFIGRKIYNETDGSYGTITDNTATTITVSGGLSGGTDNDFDTNDAYTIEAASVVIDNCLFTEHTGNRGIYIEGNVGDNNIVTNNRLPFSTATNAIEFGNNTAYNGTHDIEGNTFGVGGSIEVNALQRLKKVTPEMFGAVPNVDDAPSRAANDAAFAAALVASREVIVGTEEGAGLTGRIYYMEGKLNVPAYHSLRGAGWRRTQLKWNTAMTAGSAVTLNGYNTLTGISIAGPDDASKHGLYIQNESHGRNEIRDCHFNQWEDGIRLHRAQITSFYQCYISDNVNGVHCINNATSGEGTDGAVNACLFEGGEINLNSVGVLIHGGCNSTTLREVAIQGNTSKGVRMYGPELKRSISIDNCYFESNGTHHIHIESTAIAYRTRITDNGFMGSAGGTTDKITLDQAFGTVIRGNYYTDDLADDITLASAARDSIIEMGWRDQIEPVVITGTGTRTRWVGQDTESTEAQLLSSTDAVNTVGKHTGRQVWDTTNGRPVWASGSGATDVWVDHAGTTVHTPVP